MAECESLKVSARFTSLLTDRVKVSARFTNLLTDRGFNVSSAGFPASPHPSI